VPLIIDQSQPFLHICTARVESEWHEALGKSLQWNTRYTQKDSQFSPKMASIIDREQPHIVCSACVESARYEVSGKPTNGRRDTAENVLILK